MKRVKGFQVSIQKRYMLGSFLLAFVPILLCFIYLYQNSLQSMRNTYIKDRAYILSQISADIEYQIGNANVVMSKIRFDPSVHALLEHSDQSSRSYREARTSAAEALRNAFLATPIIDDVKCSIVQGYEGTTIAYEGISALINWDQIRELDWFQDGEASHQITWGSYQWAQNEFAAKSYVIPVYFPIERQSSSGHTGYGVLMFEQSLFLRSYNKYLKHNEELYVINRKGQVVSSNCLDAAGNAIPADRQQMLNDVAATVAIDPNVYGAGNYTEVIDGTVCLISWNYSPVSDWITMEIMQMTEYMQLQNQQQRLIILLTVFLLILIWLFSMIMVKTVTKPLKQIVHQVEEIGRGHFGKVSVSGSSQEVNILAGSINQMQESIEQLMKESREHEHEQYILEMQMLQSQINPHFLYNTLNNIRLMAAMQGATGIARMTDALSNMMRYALTVADKPTVIDDELAVAGDYIHIQNIRYKGSIEYEVEIADESALQCVLPRFTLQPLVENSIVHGLLAASSELGRIRVRIISSGNRVMIEIYDNGKGLSAAAAADINERLKAGDFRIGSENGGIGIYNVNRRIQLLCGKEYGLYFESEEDVYTKVIICLKRGEQGG